MHGSVVGTQPSGGPGARLCAGRFPQSIDQESIDRGQASIRALRRQGEQALPTAVSKIRAADPVSVFFSVLAEPGHLATFEGQSATLRFDIGDGDGDAEDVDRWHVRVTNGDVTVTHRSGPADAIVRVQRRQFAAMVTGTLNAQAALLRGLLTCEGSAAAFIMFQRCLPGPPGSTGRAAPISSKTVMDKRRAM